MTIRLSSNKAVLKSWERLLEMRPILLTLAGVADLITIIKKMTIGVGHSKKSTGNLLFSTIAGGRYEVFGML